MTVSRSALPSADRDTALEDVMSRAPAPRRDNTSVRQAFLHAWAGGGTRRMDAYDHNAQSDDAATSTPGTETNLPEV